MFSPVYRQLIAIARGTTVGGSILTSYAKGCSLTRSSTGVVSLTLDAAVGFTDAATDSDLDPTCLTTGQVVTPADTSAQVKTFNFFAAGGTTATEGAFILRVYRVITR